MICIYPIIPLKSLISAIQESIGRGRLPMMNTEMAKGGKRPGAGRPKMPAAKRRSETYLIRATRAQMDAWDKAARVRELPLADWMRQVLDAAAVPKKS